MGTKKDLPLRTCFVFQNCIDPSDALKQYCVLQHHSLLGISAQGMFFSAILLFDTSEQSCPFHKLFQCFHNRWLQSQVYIHFHHCGMAQRRKLQSAAMLTNNRAGTKQAQEEKNKWMVNCLETMIISVYFINFY